MIRSVHLDVKDVEGVRELLRMAGVAGPWGTPDRSMPDNSLHIIERDGVSWIGTGTIDRRKMRIAGDAIAVPATIVFSRAFESPTSLLFPLHALKCVDLPPRLWPGSERLLIVRETGQTLALAGGFDDRPWLAIGLTLSDFLRNVRERHIFFGYGHLVSLLRWWIEHRLDQPLVRLQPWPAGQLPCLLSFDVEGMVARRSIGRTILRLPPARRPLVELNRLDLVRPLRGSRWNLSHNTLIDPDGRFTSHRLVVDFRRAARGCAGRAYTVPQWQLHIRLPRPPAPTPTESPAFHDWLHESFPETTTYYCGGLPAAADGRPEVGFHGTSHEHFHVMPTQELDRELARGKALLGEARTIRAVRAPGLLWSGAYFNQLSRAGFDVDSSFRECSILQPIVPIRTAAGWWELPVNGNLLTLADLGQLIRAASHTGSMLNLHCHDHEVEDDAARDSYRQRVTMLEQAGFARCGHIAMIEWLNRSQINEISAIEPVSSKCWRVHVSATEGTALLLPRAATAAHGASQVKLRAMPAANAIILKTGSRSIDVHLNRNETNAAAV